MKELDMSKDNEGSQEVMVDTLTANQKWHLDELFIRYEEKMNKQYEESIAPELKLLSRYKGDLAKAYNEVASQRTSLLGCMQEFISNQEALYHMTRELIKVISGKYPRSLPRIDVSEEEHWK